MSEDYIPKPYMSDGIEWVLSHNIAGLLFPPGLGKTAVMLTAFNTLKKEGLIDNMLVISPIRVATIVWPAEVKKWNHTKHLSISVLHGLNKEYAYKQKSDIYTINPEGMKWLFNKGLPGPKTARWMLVCDESTLFKTHSSLRFKTLKLQLDKFKCRYILTGTPMPNGMLQIWPQVFILDKGYRLGKFFTHYRNKYFYPSGYGGYSYRIVKGADEQIYRLIDDIVMHKSADELDLPEISYNVINVELDSVARKLYDDTKNHYIAQYGDNLILATNAAAAANKLKQISNGSMYVDSITVVHDETIIDRNVIHVHDEKINVIKEMVESLAGSPLLVMYEYNHDLSALQKAFPHAPHIGGGVKPAVLAQTIASWNAGNVPVMFLQPAAGGHGLNLQDGGCHNVIWMSITFDLELYMQANKRVHRQGVKNAVVVHHIVTTGTVDEKIMSVLEGKSKLQDMLLEAVKK